VKRRVVISSVAVAAVALFAYWLASHTEWVDTRVPMPLRGEARTNPSYAAQRFVEALGAHATRDRMLTIPPPDAVIVLSVWNWDLSKPRRESLERWVESGGRLVVDDTLIGNDQEFERWSRIGWRIHVDKEAPPGKSADDPCRRFDEERNGRRAAPPDATSYRICDVSPLSSLTSTQTAQWALRDASGPQVMRVAAGRGSVTVLNGEPFRYLSLFDGDHGALLAAATQLRRGDEVHFLSEEDQPSLLALAWQHGTPVVCLSMVLVALGLWRRGVRFGPLAAPQALSRRSLTEQIRGTGQFALRYGGQSLHAATLRALDEGATRRIPGFARLDTHDRVAALAALTGIDAPAIAAAADSEPSRTGTELRRAIALLETVRRRVGTDRGTRTGHASR
jgi:hypothetical protein